MERCCRCVAKIRSVLGRRLRRAGFAAADRDLLINLYRKAFRLRIVGGNIAEAEEVGFVGAATGCSGGDLCIPPDAFCRLILGFRDLEQIRDAWPDTVVDPGARPILDARFPRMTSLILMPY